MLGDKIGNWKEDGTWIWRNEKYPNQFLRIDIYEDCDAHIEDGACDCHEIWLGDDNTGNWECEDICDSFIGAIRRAKRFMMEHPDGWLYKTQKKIPFIFR